MIINLGDISIELERTNISLSNVLIDGEKKRKEFATSKLNCVFKNGFKNGSDARNFYFFHKKDTGLIFKAGMVYAPFEMFKYMEFLKSEYSEFVSNVGFLDIEYFLSYLVFKRRSGLIDFINK